MPDRFIATGIPSAMLVATLLCSPCLTNTSLSNDAKKSASWGWPQPQQLEDRMLDYLRDQPNPQRPLEELKLAWETIDPSTQGPLFLDQLLNWLALSDVRLERVLSQIEQAGTQGPSHLSRVDLSWMETNAPTWVQSNVRLAFARALAQHNLYDEALQQLTLIDENLVVDPSTLLFYRAVCHHHLLDREDCLENLTSLLERESELPSRYAITARLMKADIEPLEEDSLDEVARLMKDVERRLDLGRTGKVVRDQEQQIVEKLDKIIEQIEQQLQQQQQQRQQQKQQQQGQQAQQQQGQAMEDSQAADIRGDGDVDSKDIGNKSGWGDLPPAQRQEALQNITKDLPSHYREVIEAYFKRLATSEPQ